MRSKVDRYKALLKSGWNPNPDYSGKVATGWDPQTSYALGAQMKRHGIPWNDCLWVWTRLGDHDHMVVGTFDDFQRGWNGDDQ